MFSEKTIDRIKTRIHIALGDKDFLSRGQLISALNRAGLKISSSQLTRDVDLLNQCNVKGFTHFKYDKGYDRKSCEAMVAYRSLATSRGRAQAVYYLNTVIDLLSKDSDIGASYQTIEVQKV